VAINHPRLSYPPQATDDITVARPLRRRHLLAMAAGVFAIAVGVWALAPTNSSNGPGNSPVTTVATRPLP
jgi:hypothetical protein